MADTMIPNERTRASANMHSDISALPAEGTSRRTFLAGATAAAAGLASVTGAQASAEEPSDQVLFAAWEAFCERRHAFCSLPTDWTDKQRQPYGDLMDRAEERFLSIAPKTFAGIALKLRHAWYWNASDARPEAWDIVIGHAPLPEGQDFPESLLLRLARDVDALVCQGAQHG